MQNKKGISLIVLVITIIVMIILAASVVITLSNTGIINKATHAVKLTDAKQVQDLAALAWADAYMEGYRGNALEYNIKESLKKQGITDETHFIVVTDKGIETSIKDVNITLGTLVTSASDYGKTINYVSDNGVEDWKIFYHTEDYVYLIASEALAYDKMPTNIPGASVLAVDVPFVNGTKRTVGHISWASAPVGVEILQENCEMWMANFNNYANNNGKTISYFLSEEYWGELKNTKANYKDYIVGAIGTPTVEMFAASWNAKRAITNNTTIYNKKLGLVENGTVGYYINDITNGEAASNTTTQTITTLDNLYLWSDQSNSSIWLSSPAANAANNLMGVYRTGIINNNNYTYKYNAVRPVVCLRADIPAAFGNTTDYII